MDIHGFYKAYYSDHDGMGSANERRRYVVTSAHIGWAHTHNDPYDMISEVISDLWNHNLPMLQVYNTWYTGKGETVSIAKYAIIKWW